MVTVVQLLFLKVKPIENCARPRYSIILLLAYTNTSQKGLYERFEETLSFGVVFV